MTDTESNSKELLNEVFGRIGKQFDFEEVTADYATFGDLKLKWTRNNHWIAFDISDFLKDAPENVIEGIATAVLKRIRGDTASNYNEDVCKYVTSDEFIQKNQETYIRRFRGISEGTKGFHVDLQDSYDRLLKKGLIDEDPNIVIRWAGNAKTKLGTGSVLMHVVTLTKFVDSDSLTDNAIDYALYAQIMHVTLGFNPDEDYRLKEARYQEMLNQYPGRMAAEQELTNAGIRT